MDLALIVLEKTWLFILSWSMLIWTSQMLAHIFSRSAFDRFWIFISAAYLQVSSISLLLSLFRKLAPVPFLVFQIILVVGLIIWGVKNHLSLWPFVTPRIPVLGVVGFALLGLVLLLLGNSFLSRILTPIHWGDVLYYHASRPLYWIQHRSIGPYPTVNDRQISFAFGSDLIFLYPVLFAREEIVGRLFYWLGGPLAAFGFYSVMRQMGQNLVRSLFGVVVFLTIPLVYVYTGTLEPLIWMCLFALGTGYWILRLTQSRSPSAVVLFQLGAYTVLAANVKNYGLALVGGVFLVGVIFLWVRELSGKSRFQIGSIFLISLLITSLLSGLGLLFAQNLAFYSSFTGSQLRTQQNLTAHSPYQVYVHLIRLGAVLLEFPVPFVSGVVDQLGQGVVELLGADCLLPREDTWSWVGHYQYRSRELFQAKSFGVLGLILIAGGWGLGKKIKDKFSTMNLQAAGRKVLQSPLFSYFIISLSLILGPALLLRWIDSGTRSFLTPGLVLLLPLGVSGLSRLKWKRPGPGLIAVLVLIFIVAFTGSAVQKVARDFRNTAPHWGKVKYSRRRPHISSDRYIPRDATVILLGYPNTKDYYFFGEDYSRQVIQWPNPFDEKSLEEVKDISSEVYIYLDEKRCDRSQVIYFQKMVDQQSPNFQFIWGPCYPGKILENDSQVKQIDWDEPDKLYQLISQ